MNYAEIKNFDVANGPGVRVVLFVSGCTNHCEGCFQPQTWDFNYGQRWTKEVEDKIIRYLSEDFIQGITILGGEPFELENQPSVADLIHRIKTELPTKDIWMFTGFVYDKDLQPNGRRYGSRTDEILDSIDVLVDGPFILARKNLSLLYRGSENQRLLDMKKTRKAGSVVLWSDSQSYILNDRKS